MSTWQYTNEIEGGGTETINLSGAQYQTVSDVQTYATAQGHTISGGVNPPNSTLYLVKKDDPVDLLSVDSNGDLVISGGQANALSGNNANSVLMLDQNTGETLYPGKGMKVDVNSSNEWEANDLSDGDVPVLWANGAHTDSNSGEYVVRGKIDNVKEVYKSASSHYLKPLSSSDGVTAVYWDIENKRFTTSNNGWPECGGFDYSAMSYILDSVTTVSWSANIVIDSTAEVNEIRNKTILTPTSGGTFRHFTINDPNNTNDYDDIWETGDRVAIVWAGGSGYQGTISVANSAELLDPDGNPYGSNLLIVGSSSNDQSHLLEVVDDSGTQKWQIIKIDTDIVEIDVNVDYHLMQSELNKAPIIKENSDDTWHTVGINDEGGLTTKQIGSSSTVEFAKREFALESFILDGFEAECTTDHVINIKPGKALSDSEDYLIKMPSAGTIDITTSGAGAGRLDTGTIATEQWYYVWIFADSSDDSTELRISLSNSSPTVPSGYDKKALICVAKTDGSSNFRRFGCYGRGADKKYIWEDELLTVNNGTASTTRQTVNATSRVPSMPRGYGYCSISAELNASSNALRIHHRNTTETFTFIRGDARYGSVPQIMLNSSGQFGYSCNSGTITGVYIKITSFDLRL